MLNKNYKYFKMSLLFVFSFLIFNSAKSQSINYSKYKYVTYNSSHFILLAPRGVNVNELINECEDSYNYVVKFGVTLPNRIKGITYSTTSEFVNIGGGSYYNLGLSVNNEIRLQPLSLLLKRGGFSKVLRHELTHIALNKAEVNGLPRWFNEGLAMNVSKEELICKMKFSTLKQIQDTILKSKNYENVRSAYSICINLISKLISLYGKDKVIKLTELVSNGNNFEIEFKALTNKLSKFWCSDF